MFVRQRMIVLNLLHSALFLGVVLFALYEFKLHTIPQPIAFTTAETALRTGNDAAARKEFDDAIRLRPRDPIAYISVIQACVAQKRPTIEIEYAQRAIEACKKEPADVISQFYELESDAYTELDHTPHQQRAIEAAKRALDLSPNSLTVQNQYGYLLADNAAGKGPDVDLALGILRKALDGVKGGKLSPGEQQLGPLFVAETEDSYGWALYKNDQFPDAFTTLTQAIEDYPDNAPGEARKVSYYHLGMVYSKLKRPDQANNAFKSALAYDPKYEDAQTGLLALKSTTPIATP